MPRSLLHSLVAASLLLWAGVSLGAGVKVEVLQSKLEHPWSMAFLPDN